MTKPAFYSARTWFAPPSADQLAPLLAAGCPAPWLEQEVFGPRDDGHYAWVGQVRAQPVAALVGKCEGDALHVQGWLAPSLRGLGLATEALDALAGELLVRVGHVPTPDDPRPFTRRHRPTRLVVAAASPTVARVAERCGAVVCDGVWVLDLVGHTGLDRSPALTGQRIARLLASLRPADGAALEPLARAHHQRLQAVIEAARARVKPTPRYRGVQELVDRPPPIPATKADVEAVRERAWAGQMTEVLALVGGRWFSDAQLDAITSALDDHHLPERERSDAWADIANWLSDYQRVRRG